MQDSSIDTENFRDVISTVDQRGKRVWVNPKMSKGRFTNYRNIVYSVLLVLLFAGPFMRINGHPFMLFNLSERKFIIAGIFFGSQDTFLFALFMLAGIIFIALFTVIYGRLFCGWVCPQTVFMEHVFRRIEFWIEGDYTRQKALRLAPWNSEKIFKKILKNFVFITISFLIANTFLAYIVGTEVLYTYVTHGPDKNIGLFVTLCIFTLVFYFVFAWMREQVCIIICPYGRMQSVLLDRKSMVVAYDFKRGEKRGNPKKNKDNPEIGDCIDCHQCVNVCPTGIDIRNGTQLECIGCTACIDACDGIMDRIGKPRGLVRYASVENIEQKKKFKFNVRIVAYSIVLGIIIIIISILLITRQPVKVEALRVPGTTYQTRPDGKISNLYQVKFSSRMFHDFTPELRLVQPTGELEIIGSAPLVKAGDVTQLTMIVLLDKDQIHGLKEKATIGIFNENEKITEMKITFFGPVDKINKP
jgi:cytochrome c oxidase accessory protein FixG